MAYRSRKVLVATIVVAGAIFPAASAQGSLSQPSVVSDNPANFTPNIIDDAVVPKSSVDALVQVGNTMYAGGAFNSVQDSSRTNTVTRANLMSFDASTGAINDFAPDVNKKVFALASDGTDLYVGGYFSRVNGVYRRGIAKIDPVSGEVVRAFNARLKGPVQEIRLTNGRLIVGGKFPQRLLALDPDTGADTGYIDIDIEGSVASNAGKTDVYRFAVNPSGTRLVAIGNFTTVNGQAQSRAFMLDLNADSASLSSWYYEPLMNCLSSLAVARLLARCGLRPRWVVLRDGLHRVHPAVRTSRHRMSVMLRRRFEVDVPAPAKRPTWINYTGGDTLHSVAVTGAAVYVQGHQRWLGQPARR